MLFLARVAGAAGEKKKHQQQQNKTIRLLDSSKSRSTGVSPVCYSLRLLGRPVRACPLRLPNHQSQGDKHTQRPVGGGAAAGLNVSRLELALEQQHTPPSHRGDRTESISDGKFYFFLLHVATDFKYVSSSPHNILYCSNGLFDRHAPRRYATSVSGLAVSYRVVTHSSACGSSPAAGCQQRGTVKRNQTHMTAKQNNKQLFSLFFNVSRFYLMFNNNKKKTFPIN